jgi:hypothetical protein
MYAVWSAFLICDYYSKLLKEFNGPEYKIKRRNRSAEKNVGLMHVRESSGSRITTQYSRIVSRLCFSNLLDAFPDTHN